MQTGKTMIQNASDRVRGCDALRAVFSIVPRGDRVQSLTDMKTSRKQYALSDIDFDGNTHREESKFS